MATITPTVSVVGGNNGVGVVTWGPCAAGDTCTGFLIPRGCGAQVGVQVDGTFNTTAITMQGSNDNTTYVTLTDRFAAAFSKTAAAFGEFQISAAYVKPVLTGGTGTALYIRMTLRGPNWG